MQVRFSWAVCAGLASFAAHADEALWKSLQSTPNLVVFVRHAQPAPETFRQRGIEPVVISSPMCRCRDTARLAFGDAMQMDPSCAKSRPPTPSA